MKFYTGLLLFSGFVAYAQGVSIVFAKLRPETFTYGYVNYLLIMALIFISIGIYLLRKEPKKVIVTLKEKQTI